MVEVLRNDPQITCTMTRSDFKDSSVNYCILSYLPWQEILCLQALNKKFYKTFVPTVLSNLALETTCLIRGAMPINRKKTRHYFVETGKKKLQCRSVAELTNEIVSSELDVFENDEEGILSIRSMGSI